MTICSHQGATYRNHIYHAHNHGQNASGDHNPPKRKPQRLLTGGWRVEIAQHADPQHHHYYSQCYKPGFLTQQWPVSIEVVAKERKLGDD